MKKILFVFPTAWDKKQLERCRSAWEGKYDILFTEPSDAGCPADFDIISFIEKTAETYRGKIDGVTSSSDYPGATVAGAIAQKLGLPGSPAETVIRCSHKYYSRLAQRESVPEATARFQLVDPTDLDTHLIGMDFPCFIKPVKGAFSVMTKKLNRQRDLTAFLQRSSTQTFTGSFLNIFNELVAKLTNFELGGSYFLIEEFLHGQQVTVEGYARQGDVEIIGIVDSLTQPGTGSFARFDYPSCLRPEVQERMADITRRVIRHIGLKETLFNIEMIYEPVTESLKIVEINPRMCGQFGDLYQKVDGINGYEIALALAAGDAVPAQRGAGAFRDATSFPLRVYEPVRVLRTPEAEDIRAAEALYPGTLIWWECDAGQELADFESLEDGESFRYGVVNLGADSRPELLVRLEKIKARLGYEFAPVKTAA